MAKIAARNASIYVDDSANACQALSSFFNSVTLTYSAEAPEVTGFGSNNRERMQDGIKDTEFTGDAYFGTGAAETDAVFNSILGASSLWRFGPAGSGTGQIMYAACAVLTSYEMTFGVEDAGQCSFTFVNRSGSLTRTTASWPA